MTNSIVPIEDFLKDYSMAISCVRQRDFIYEGIFTLNILFYMAEAFLKDRDYELFRKQIARILKIPGVLRREGSQPGAVSIHNKLIGNYWMILDARNVQAVDEPFYLPVELSYLSRCKTKDFRHVHEIRKRIGFMQVVTGYDGVN